MNDYSDLIFLMGGLIIFSLLSLQTNRLFQLNNRIQLNGELEYNAVSIAQDEIDQIRWIKSESAFNDHLSTYPKQVPLIIDDDTLQYDVDINSTSTTIPGSSLNDKKVSITVSNEFLKTNSDDDPGERFIRLQYIKSFN